MWQTDKVIQEAIQVFVAKGGSTSYSVTGCSFHTLLLHFGLACFLKPCNTSRIVVHLRLYFRNFKSMIYFQYALTCKPQKWQRPHIFTMTVNLFFFFLKKNNVKLKLDPCVWHHTVWWQFCKLNSNCPSTVLCHWIITKNIPGFRHKSPSVILTYSTKTLT